MDPVRPEEKRPTRQFRKYKAAARLSPDELRRQNDVLQSARQHFVDAAPMIAFLNNRHPQLDGGQPLHLAVQSDDGLMRVKRLLQPHYKF